MHLGQHRRGALSFDQGRVRDLRVGDPLCLIAAGDPQELVLEERIIPVIRVLPVRQDLHDSPADIVVGDLPDLTGVERHRILRARSFTEDVSIQIHLLQVRKDRLPVLEDRQRPADPRYVEGGVLRVIEDQVGKIHKSIVVDPPRHILAGQAAVTVLLCRDLPPPSQLLLLLPAASKPQFFYIIERIPDLMADPQCDQNIRMQIGVHVGVQVRAEFVLTPDICLDDRPLLVQPVVLGLAHQRLGNGRDLRLHLHSSVRIDVGHLGIPQPENVDQPVVAVDIARHRSPDHQKAVLSLRERQPAERRQVPDQISGAVVGRGEDEVHDGRTAGLILRLFVQVHDDVLLFIQIKALKPLHS